MVKGARRGIERGPLVMERMGRKYRVDKYKGKK
jgi:hypothetical protein